MKALTTVTKIRSVKFVKSNTSHHHHLINKLVDFKSTCNSEEEIKKLILDVRRWNGIFCIIERFIKLWNVIKKILFVKDKIPEMLIADELVTLKEIGSVETTRLHDAGMFDLELHHGIKNNTAHIQSYTITGAL